MAVLVKFYFSLLESIYVSKSCIDWFDLTVIPCRSSSEMTTYASSTYVVVVGASQTRSPDGSCLGWAMWRTRGRSAVKIA